jgi:hypothetical protein
MPKVKYTEAKGLYQESGAGLDLSGDLALTGALSVSKTLSFSNKLVGSVDAKSTGGAVSLNTLTTLVSTVIAGNIAMSLAAGTAGQLKILLMTARSGTADVILTVTGGLVDTNNTITFNSVGDAVVLVYTGAKWAVVTNNGAAITTV